MKNTFVIILITLIPYILFGQFDPNLKNENWKIEKEKVIHFDVNNIKLFECDKEGNDLNFKEIKRVNFLRFESCNKSKENLVSIFHKSVIYIVVYSENKEYKIDGSVGIGRKLFYDYIEEYIKLSDIEKDYIENKNRDNNNNFYFEKNKLASEKKRNDSIEEIKSIERIYNEHIEAQNQIKLSKLQKIINDSLSALDKRQLIFDYNKDHLILKNSLNQIYKSAMQNGGFVINEYYVNWDDDRINISIGLANFNKKRIKYAHFTLQAYNSVNDPIYEAETLKGIGFVETMGTSKWEFENVYYSSLIEYVKIKSVTIIFEDGSRFTTSKMNKNNILTEYPSFIDIFRDVNTKGYLVTPFFINSIVEKFDSNIETFYVLKYFDIHSGEMSNFILNMDDLKLFKTQVEEIIIGYTKRSNYVSDNFEISSDYSFIYFNNRELNLTILNYNDLILLRKTIIEIITNHK